MSFRRSRKLPCPQGTATVKLFLGRDTKVPRARAFTGPDDRRIRRALCIVAHPDDIEFYCGGTLLKMTSRGVLVDFVLATSGDKGSRDATRSRAKVARIREREQEAAAYVLGTKRV